MEHAVEVTLTGHFFGPDPTPELTEFSVIPKKQPYNFCGDCHGKKTTDVKKNQNKKKLSFLELQTADCSVRGRSLFSFPVGYSSWCLTSTWLLFLFSHSD